MGLYGKLSHVLVISVTRIDGKEQQEDFLLICRPVSFYSSLPNTSVKDSRQGWAMESLQLLNGYFWKVTWPQDSQGP